MSDVRHGNDRKIIRILHCADLHLSNAGDEREYSLSVLDEIASKALRESARYLLFSGDTFNSFADAEALRVDFRSRMKTLQGSCEVILLSGNHEDLGRKGRRLASFDLGIQPQNIVEPSEHPFTLMLRDGVEFFAIPHRPHYNDYTEWSVPDKEKPFRVALAHGIVAGMSYTWQDEETSAPAGVMDPDLFERNRVDYAALGHIHSFRRRRSGVTEIVYPGSARVWRKNETGPRRVVLVTLDEGVDISTLKIASAGQYRSIDIFIDFDGTLSDAPLDDPGEPGPADFVHLRFFGLVEDERKTLNEVNQLVMNLKTRVRRVECETRLTVLEGISRHPVAQKFVHLIERKKPEAESDQYPTWKRAREMGLLKIKEIIEAGL
ncbi:MAG: metallophosphoesterase [Desulfatiglandaceae bacterium]